MTMQDCAGWPVPITSDEARHVPYQARAEAVSKARRCKSLRMADLSLTLLSAV